MKFFVIVFALISAATAAGISSDYLPPVTENSLPKQEYVPPVADDIDASADSALADDGYRYKIVRKLKFKQRRDVSELPQNEYLPPAEEKQETLEATEQPAEEIAKAPEEESAVKSADGYRYKVVRRLKYRYRTRRDVNEVSAKEYLPPVEEKQEEAVATETPIEESADESAVKSADGYRYKVVRRLKYRARTRRDVNEAIANEYLPPAEENVAVTDLPVEASADRSAVKSADGYRYKAVRTLKYRYRQRRDVNELPAADYLPPADDANETVEPISEYLPPAEEKSALNEAPAEEPEESAVKDEDGYHYKVVRRLKYRHRRDVEEAPANEYLPPVEESAEVAVTDAPIEEAAVKGADGYRYKVVRRLKYRYRTRRDVSETPAYDYVPPAAEKQAILETTEVPVESGVKAEDGYRYKVVRRLKYRQRRDVNELPTNDYLPPTENAVDVIEPTSEYLPPPTAKNAEVVLNVASAEEPQETAVKAEDGYHYKVVRRLKYRQRRDVEEVPTNEYLPPAEETKDEATATEVPVDESAVASAVKAADGYRYKVVRRLKYRYRTRRDVNETPVNEYLPPAEESAEAAVTEAAVEVPDESAVKSADGYHYKVVRRLKYRHRQRRDADAAPAYDYLAPTAETKSAEVAEEHSDDSADSAKLADDGYQYKVVRRLKYRRH